MEEGLCYAGNTIVIMDERTHHVFKSVFTFVVMPDLSLLVVPESKEHSEKSLYEVTIIFKEELSLSGVPPARERAFAECTMLMVMLDPNRFVKGRLSA